MKDTLIAFAASALMAGTAAFLMLAAPGTSAAPDKHAKKNIVDTAVAAGSFKTLAAALQAAGLVDALKGPGPFTVFAPTDEAFAKLPPGTLDALLADKAQLTKVLTYHVVAGSYPAAKILEMGSGKLATVNGDSLTVSVRGGKVYVDDAQVLTTDVKASNGIIHVIDAVILPGAAAGAAGR